MTKGQKDVLMKAFRLIRAGAAEGERVTREGNLDEVASHVDAMLTLVAEMKKSIGHVVGADAVLKGVEITRPKAAAKVGRPKLHLVKS